ncbi:DUF3040 domain-containing protein [Paramicrobacterium agarici]|uniref:DUF3040 family protein n=1 Tax=Paramicrobacterium agarici TaxID=630514 RepID=A0A2A9DZW2_9MICO|nr:DUF3040 domain-containing protein [Microbacterium agarici]PFG31460.1 Protein of unknown function (DUF3040) [Microbacterium agarici]TQO21348.1 DUF3040 family protein [Microbacterium agarici]
MPLSEQEQKLLDEMERHLYRNDADFVSTSGDRRGRPSYRSIALGSLVVLVGIAALVAAVMIQQPIVGVIGFVVMLGGVLLAMKPSKNAPAPSGESARQARTGNSRGNLMDKLNDRWDRRQDNDR